MVVHVYQYSRNQTSMSQLFVVKVQTSEQVGDFITAASMSIHNSEKY